MALEEGEGGWSRGKRRWWEECRIVGREEYL